MRAFIPFIAITLFSFDRIAAQQIYATSKGHVSFFANAPVADVDAHSARAKITLETSTGELTVSIQSQFGVALKDHNIETPKILGQEMTEDKVMVKIEAMLLPKSK